MAKYTDDIAKLGELTLNDTAANTYLTMLVNIGILGLVAYLTFLIFILKFLLKNRNQWSIIFTISFICFIIQDFFNLWVVLIIPVYWVLTAIMYLSIIDNPTSERKKENE